MESAFSPNTSAFINYLSNLPQDSTSTNVDNPTSLPPSAFFSMPVPGRDTPEDTPPSLPSASPEKAINDAGQISFSEDSDSVSPERQVNSQRKNSGANNKRKAGAAAHAREIEGEEDEDDDSDSDIPSGHEDKRQHGNEKGGRKGGRKSGAGEDGKSSKEPNKAARRKEQNRAAQKAFRERREAKVKDLEAKVAELEAKSFGASVENENLRGILKRLQEENVALKQSAFTFSMPVNGTNGTNTPTNTSAFSAPQRQVPKPPSPPHTNTDDSLTSINDLPALSHRSSTGTNVDSPESLVSVGSNQDNPPSLFAGSTFDAFALGGRPEVLRAPLQKPQPAESHSFSSTSSASVSPPSSNQSDINALWASLYPNGVGSGFGTQTQTQQQSNANQLSTHQPTQQPQNPPSPFTLLTSQPEFMSFANAGINMSTPTQPNTDFNRFAFRDTSAENNATTNWADITDNSMNDFLASLSGDQPAQDTTADLTAEDDAFNAQLQQIFGNNSPSAAFNLPTNPYNGLVAFSPGNYLNMSPSPLNSVSNSQSPRSSNDKSASGSPESSGSTSSHPTSVSASVGPLEKLDTCLGTFGPTKSESEIVHIVDTDGKLLKPADMWVRFGMQHDKVVEHLVIDDLCEQMRSKATCKDGKMQLSVKDAEQMFLGEYEGNHHKEWLDGVKRRLIGAQTCTGASR
ncbi:hypothetical protein IAR55_001599 [Kwoniella newhampshirensis]|uniref:BZIP domain-containing protein n=1 Tax=Kwoniella newhampshirensis TaxID=1651941 RepID=A0AAW0Z2T6_9TREE